MDVVLFSNYEAQVDALLAGQIDIAWNTNLAYVRTVRATDGTCRVLAMRDTDLGFRTLLVGRAWVRSPVRRTLRDARSRSAAPILRRPPSCPSTTWRKRARGGHRLRRAAHDCDVGKHGDTGRSEREALDAVLDGRADAAAVGAASWDAFVRTGEVPPEQLGPFWTSPPYSHCNFTAARGPGRRGRRRVGVAPARDGLANPSIGRS